VSEDRLWAPWRMEYIAGPKPEECIFCAKPAAGDDADTLIVRRGERCFVILNAYPYTNGHVMIAPYDHVPSLDDLDEATSAELTALTQESLRALRAAYGPDGFNIGINLGNVAGAGVEDHVHQHVVPRWGGDTNFMPAIGATRVLPQSLADSYEQLREAFASLGAGTAR
jgi:ATP adenylyltransferase